MVAAWTKTDATKTLKRVITIVTEITTEIQTPPTLRLVMSRLVTPAIRGIYILTAVTPPIYRPGFTPA